MKKYLVILLVFILLPLSLWAEEPGGADAEIFPDLLEEGPPNEYQPPDLLADDPFIKETGTVLADPHFEDDLSIEEQVLAISDPLEPVNRFFFEFNDRLYFWVLKPVKNVYSEILPADIRGCVGNFFTNLGAPIRFVNNLLQGEVEDAGVVAGRFVINTILGIGGLGDPAYRDFDIEPRGADLGQTLGKWGIGEGIYLCWPGLGPSTVRDTFGFIGDAYLHPAGYVYDSYYERAGFFAMERINVLSLSQDVYEDLKRMSLDPYVASRQAFFEYRRSVIEKK